MAVAGLSVGLAARVAHEAVGMPTHNAAAQIGPWWYVSGGGCLGGVQFFRLNLLCGVVYRHYCWCHYEVVSGLSLCTRLTRCSTAIEWTGMLVVHHKAARACHTGPDDIALLMHGASCRFQG